MDRVIVFLDYQNLHGEARRRFIGPGADPASGHVYPLRIGELVVKRRNRPSELKQVRVYRGRPNPERQPGAARANDRQTSDWQRSDRVVAVRRNVQYPPNWPTAPAAEKGIDVAIATDMIRLAMSGEMDAAVLFSADKDLLPALETIRDFCPDCRAEVAAWSGRTARLRFEGTQQPWCHYLSESDFWSVHDPFNYADPN